MIKSVVPRVLSITLAGLQMRLSADSFLTRSVILTSTPAHTINHWEAPRPSYQVRQLPTLLLSRLRVTNLSARLNSPIMTRQIIKVATLWDPSLIDLAVSITVRLQSHSWASTLLVILRILTRERKISQGKIMPNKIVSFCTRTNPSTIVCVNMELSTLTSSLSEQARPSLIRHQLRGSCPTMDLSREVTSPIQVITRPWVGITAAPLSTTTSRSRSRTTSGTRKMWGTQSGVPRTKWANRWPIRPLPFKIKRMCCQVPLPCFDLSSFV